MEQELEPMNSKLTQRQQNKPPERSKHESSTKKVDEIILSEARKMVEFDDFSNRQLEKVLHEMNQLDIDPLSIDLGSIDNLSFEDIKGSSKHLSEKMHMVEELNMEITPHSSTEKLTSMTQDQYGVGVALKTGLGQGWLWRLQARFGSTTASFFNFLKWMIIMNFYNAFLILGLIMTPQLITYFQKIKPDIDLGTTNDNTTCLGKMMDQTVFYPLENASYCCSQLYQSSLDSTKPLDDTLSDRIQDFLTAVLTGNLRN